MAPEHLGQSARPALALDDERAQVARHLHPHQRAGFITHIVAGALQLPGHVDVFSRHFRAVGAHVDERGSAECAHHARHGEDAAPDALRAAQQADDRREFDHLQLRQVGVAIMDARVTGHAGDACGLEVRRHPAQDHRIGRGIGVHDEHDLTANAGQRVVHRHRLALIALFGDQSHLAALDEWPHRLACAIGRCVIDDHDLEIGVIDREGAAQRLGDVLLLAVCRDQYGGRRIAQQHRRLLGRDVACRVTLAAQVEEHPCGDPHDRAQDRVEREEHQRPPVGRPRRHRQQEATNRINHEGRPAAGNPAWGHRC